MNYFLLLKYTHFEEPACPKRLLQNFSYRVETVQLYSSGIILVVYL